MLGLTELVSDALGNRKQKESETNTKIVDLFKEAFDEIKNCRSEQQRVEFHVALACVVSPRHARVCVRSRTRIEVLWNKPRGARLYV